MPVSDVRRIYHGISINHSKMETGCDCLPHLDHLSQEPPGCGDMACCRVTVTTRASHPIRTKLFQIERLSSGEPYFNELGCFATEQPFKRAHHTVRFCSKWVLWCSWHNWKHFSKEGPFKMHWMREDRGGSNFSSTHEASCNCLSDVCHIQYVLTHRFVKLPTVVILSFLWCIKVRGRSVFSLPAHSGGSLSVISPDLAHIFSPPFAPSEVASRFHHL